MADDKHKRDEPDRASVSGSEDYEVRYLSEKFGVAEVIVRKALSVAGNSRDAVEDFLKEYKKGNPL